MENLRVYHKLVVDSIETLGQVFPLSPSQVAVLKKIELLDGARNVQNIVTALEEVIQGHKERGRRILPLSLGLCLVHEVGILELGAHVDRDLQLVTSSFDFVFVLHVGYHCFSRNVLACPLDYCIRDFPDQQNYSGRGFVVVGV